MRQAFKCLFFIFLCSVGILPLTACSTNPATGASQLSFLSASQEAKMGAEEHQKVIKMFGEIDDPKIKNYVNEIGQKLAKNTERAEVFYKFFVLDTPMINAFALPGGYVYITRGILALANSEAELAAVIAHEIGHITARHSAERYSQSILASVGTLAVALATDSASAARAASVGSNLFLKSYSRGQEHESDDLGIRYLHRASYDTFAMAGFLSSMDAQFDLESEIEGRKQAPVSYFSTHPQTEDRVARASSIASTYAKGSAIENREAYLKMISGMVYGDSAKQGFARGQSFYHPEMGFTFNVPKGFKINNQPSQISATSKNGAVILFDAAKRDKQDSYTYLTRQWVSNQSLSNIERISVNGLPATTAEFSGMVSGKPVTIRIVAIEWSQDRFFRYQIAIPRGLNQAELDELKRSTYSLRRLTSKEKNSLKPSRINIVTAASGQTVKAMSRLMKVDSHQEKQFRVLNGLSPSATLLAGRRYKIVSY